MKQKTDVEKTVRDIRRRTRKQYSAEEKIRIVLAELRADLPGIRPSMGSLPGCF